MCLLTASSSSVALTLPLLEGASAIVLFFLSFVAAGPLGVRSFAVERLLGQLAQRRALAVVTVGCSVLFLRLSLLPILPEPTPSLPDDFSALLASDTFAHLRLTNPTPAMWTHFESIHVDMKPTYMSMYFPGQGLLLAFGAIVLGKPWFGILVSSALMSSAVYWMLQAWLPPRWALLGGILVALRIGLFSYWIDSYTGGGTITALAGALVLGGLPRFTRTRRPRHALLMATGVVLLAITRPYEGVLLCIPVAAALVHWFVTTQKRPTATELLRCIAPAVAVLMLGAIWLGYYDYRVFGHPLTLPYTVNRATYATAPYFVWQHPRPEPQYRHAEMRRFYQDDELADYRRVHSGTGFLGMTLIKAIRSIYFFTGFALLPLLLLLPRAVLDRRIRFLVLCLLVVAVGTAIEIFLFPHYLAPFTAALYAVGLQAARHLWHWKPGGQPAGRAMVRLMVALCFVLAAVRPWDRVLNFPIPQHPVSTWILNWFGPDSYDTQRAQVERRLGQIAGGQLAIVRYSANHDPLDEWVYNEADIDGSKVIWARDMDAVSNRELLQYYKGRKAWLVRPDLQPVGVDPYPVTEQITANSH